jgi:hypothetical protein
LADHVVIGGETSQIQWGCLVGQLHVGVVVDLGIFVLMGMPGNMTHWLETHLTSWFGVQAQALDRVWFLVIWPVVVEVNALKPEN